MKKQGNFFMLIFLTILFVSCKNENSQWGNNKKAIYFDRYVNFGNARSAKKKFEYLKKYRTAYLKQLEEAKKNSPLVYTHLKLQEIAYLNLLSNPKIVAALEKLPGKERIVFSFCDLYALTGNPRFRIFCEDSTFYLPLRNCGHPVDYFRPERDFGDPIGSQGIDMDEAFDRWLKCFRSSVNRSE